MPTKKCFKCGVKKELNLFYRHSGMKDKHLNKCIECTKKDAKIKTISKVCPICDKRFMTSQADLNDGGGKVCSRDCFYKYQKIHIRRGSKSHAWKGGRIKSGDYTLVYKKDHPNCNSSGYVFEHILVMEKHLKRVLNDGEIVHHINLIKDDNRLSNLMLFPNLGSHTAFHHQMRRKTKTKTCSECNSEFTLKMNDGNFVRRKLCYLCSDKYLKKWNKL